MNIAYESIRKMTWFDSVILDGKKFDFSDVMDTMDSLDGPGNGRVVGPLGPVLKSMGVLDACGTRDTGASKGPRFQEFLDLLHRQENKLLEREE